MQITETVAGLLREVPPGMAGAPTPCRDWDVQTLTGHLRQVGAALDLAMRGEPVPAEHWQRAAGNVDFTALTFHDPPATVSMGGMVMPGRTVADMLVADLVLHGWDLARALDRPFSAPPDVLPAVLAFVEAYAPQARGMGLFGDPVPVPADASPLERALGLSGRDASWRAATV
jgi:uncharacterized protein (TIGR03086 family)